MSNMNLHYSCLIELLKNKNGLKKKLTTELALLAFYSNYISASTINPAINLLFFVIQNTEFIKNQN